MPASVIQDAAVVADFRNQFIGANHVKNIGGFQRQHNTVKNQTLLAEDTSRCPAAPRRWDARTLRGFPSPASQNSLQPYRIPRLLHSSATAFCLHLRYFRVYPYFCLRRRPPLPARVCSQMYIGNYRNIYSFFELRYQSHRADMGIAVRRISHPARSSAFACSTQP